MHGRLVHATRMRITIYGVVIAGLAAVAVLFVNVHGASQGGTPGFVVSRSVNVNRRIAGTLWHFAPLSTPAAHVRLLLFNPTLTKAGVWLRFTGKDSVDFEHIEVPPGQTSIIRLSSLTHVNATGILLLRADSNIVPLRLVPSSGRFKVEFAVRGPAPDDSRAIPMPARVWHFPALSPPPEVVLVVLYNPNQFAVHATLVFPNGQHARNLHVAIPARVSKDISLATSQDPGIVRGLKVLASGDIIPQRTAVSPRLMRSSYATPDAQTDRTSVSSR